MLDPSTTQLLLLVMGNLAVTVITEACKDHLKNKLTSLFSHAEKLGQKDALQAAFEEAMSDACGACLEMLLKNISASGYTNEELQEYEESLKKFINDDAVAGQMLEAVKNPLDDSLPSAEVLAARWGVLGCNELPMGDQTWVFVAGAFRRQAKRKAFLSEKLREVLNAQNLDEMRRLLEQQGGVRPEVSTDKYAGRMKIKYAPADLANLMPAHADSPGQLVLSDVFVPQHVREDPPPVEIPKDLLDRLSEKGIGDLAEFDEKIGADQRQQEGLREQMEKFRTGYASQSPQPALDVIADPANRLLVFTGDPGSGKTTLMRYLLLGMFEHPKDPDTGEPLPWTAAFQDTFPLLIELRDYYGTCRDGKCNTFLEYALYMGKTAQYFFDDVWLHERLESGPSLVMFDGLDEIFDGGDRENVMQQIAGFAQRYPKARIIVTSRSLGYRDTILRGAGFRHFGVQDLDDAQIEAFTRGWFALTFPQQPDSAEQRIERILGSMKQSRSIRLLAGNPMLLTIMALLAREEELPRERAAFYEKAVEVLCHQWDANRNIRLQGVEYLNVEDKKDLLRRIAVRMQTGPGGLAGNFIHEDDLQDEIKSWFVDRFQQPPHEAIIAARTMIETLHTRNYILCLRGPGLYGFVHRTFLEFLTAAEYVWRFEKTKEASIDDLINLFDKHCADPEWREVLRLICGQINEIFVGQIVEHLATRTDMDKWDGETPLPELPLAIYCLSEVRSLGKLQDVGEILLRRTVTFFTQSVFGSLEDIVAAANEIGTRWPGAGNVSLAIEWQGKTKPGEFRWSRFIAAILKNKEVVTELLVSERWAVRSGAVEALAEHWPDNDTRQFLKQRAVKDDEPYPRVTALRVLAEHWPDDDTRRLLKKRAVEDDDSAPRSSALRALAEHWPDDDTRRLLKKRAVEDDDSAPRSSALRALAEHWPDDDTRQLLKERAVKDDDSAPRSTALEALAEHWPDDDTRKLLKEHAVEDDALDLRNTALSALAEHWPDDDTRQFLKERAVKDDDSAPRSSALRVLAEHCPDDATRQFLKERAVEDPHDMARGEAFSALGGMHSEFGRIVATKDLDGYLPYLDPLEPIPREHIEEAAEKVGILPDEIDVKVAELNEFLGWDIMQGAKAKEQ